MVQKYCFTKLLVYEALSFMVRSDEAKKDPKAYTDFYNNWGLCIKEGVAMDRANAAALAALLRYPSVHAP